MTLLRFRFQNHKSFRDDTELTMVSSRLKTTRPINDEWSSYTFRVAGIYGANASGKSSLLDAIEYMSAVIRHSATRWAERSNLPIAPFLLDETSKNSQSFYSVDLVVDGIRYEYGFNLSSQRIISEWLYEYPVGRKRLLFERNMEEDGVYRFGRALKGNVAAIEAFTGERELFLSRAAISKNLTLRPIFDALTSKIVVARFDEFDRDQRLNYIIEGLATDRIAVDDLVALLQVADIGIGEVEVATHELPAEIQPVVEALYAATNKARKGRKKPGGASEPSPENEVVFNHVARNLAFSHRGSRGKLYSLEASDQSTGTLSWLSLAVPAVEALREGSLLLVDELDASLHPQLSQVLVQMFKNSDLNRNNAQLIFTTHDTYFLSQTTDVRLDPEEVWLVEKNNAGVSDLYSLGDFSPRKNENLSRRYLHGRYGATPSVAPSFLEKVIHKNTQTGINA